MFIMRRLIDAKVSVQYKIAEIVYPMPQYALTVMLVMELNLLAKIAFQVTFRTAWQYIYQVEMFFVFHAILSII